MNLIGSICRLVCLFALITHAAGLAVMSVDFGSEFMKIAIVKPGVPMEIVLNKESHRKTPTAVALKIDERLFGEPALNTGIRTPKIAYRYLLDVIGKHFDNPLVKQFQSRFPFYDLEKDPDTGSVLFKHEDGTLFSPEELISMILQKAKEYTETFAEQTITEAVITVPPFFNQAERRAMLRAAEMAGLKVLQLINDNTAVALNYGVFRRKIFNETSTNYMFFDVGASSTSATIVGYQIVKVKSPVSDVVDAFPQLTIKGVGFDRTLGGIEFQLRLRDRLASLFDKMKKTKKDVTNDAKAMQKLYKEAGRLKHVLSANADHFAQVENLLDDEDFRVKVTREEFEDLCEDLFDRIDKVVNDVLSISQMSMDEIFEVILMGGGTRIPKVQEALMKAIGREELGKGINTDEAAALGAVYQAAHLGKGFKVKKFAIKDAVMYPIQVEFERVESQEDDCRDVPTTVKRTLFGRTQSYPQKKVMTFNKHVKDFTFEVGYGDLSFLTEQDLKCFGNTSLQSVTLTGVEDAFEEHSNEETESKGIKAHFRMDDSGIVYFDKAESTFEKLVTTEAESEESTLTKIGNTISNLFGGGKKDDTDGNIQEEETKDEIPTEETGENKLDKSNNGTSSKEKQEEKDEKDEEVEESKSDEEGVESKSDKESKSDEEGVESKSEEHKSSDKADDGDKKQETDDEKSEESKSETKEETKDSDREAESESNKNNEDKDEKEAKKNVTSANTTTTTTEKKDDKPKLKTIKINLKTEIIQKDLLDPSEERQTQAKKIIDDFKKRDEEKDLLEKAKNEIEAFIFDTQDKLEQKNYKLYSTEEERLQISEKLASVSDWLAEQEESTMREEYEAKLKEMKSATRELYGRVKEMLERPQAIEALNSIVNHTVYFLASMKNFSGDDQPFTQVEYDALENLINETKEWNKTVNEEQKKASLAEKPKFTTDDVATKISALDREVKYLINKAKMFRPKTKPKTKETNKTESANKTKTTEETVKDKKVKSEEEKDLDSDIFEEDDEEESMTAKNKMENDKTKKPIHEPDDEL